MTMATDKQQSRKNGETRGEARSDADEGAKAKPEARVLWDRFRKAHASIETAKRALEAATMAESDTLRAIAKNFGTGPFQVAGVGIVSIRHRARSVVDADGKKVLDADGNAQKSEGTYFLVTMGDKQITVVE